MLLIIAGDGKEKNYAISSPCSVEDEIEVTKLRSLRHAEKEEKLDEYQADKSPQLQLSAEHYLFQIADGGIIQVWSYSLFHMCVNSFLFHLCTKFCYMFPIL